MTWYVASVVTAIKIEQGHQEVFPVFEDFYLIEADDRDSALKKAELFGIQLQNLEDGVTFKGSPARREFLGIRKLRSIYNPPEKDLDGVPPVNGTEVSHSYFELKSEGDLKKFSTGKRVTVDYVDDDE